ncbi:hypothetical protein C1I95_30655 [Micromonospora craterilacus]|uniref:IrrE N-terminal-like domain-containing protein n=1 Tax=Micromonospora craterilacus TaxID=1655439 RepID=A0A2W2DRK2_9ACTN|nr:hypothetical protein [Micromonospora craterilacus]PZG07775.1 hypothetical protein C1I95_30655 [Micromonospora craterilacus]
MAESGPVGGAAVTPGCVRLARWWQREETTSTRYVHQVRRCDEALHGLVVPHPFALTGFIAELARRRGRPLVVRALRTRRGESRAVWCRGARTDHILVSSPRPRLHRDHLVLHGIGHMLLGHVGGPVVAAGLAQVLGAADAARLARQGRRAVYTLDEEWQAEVFATRVQQLAGLRNTHPSAAPEAVLARLSATLERAPCRAR